MDGAPFGHRNNSPEATKSLTDLQALFSQLEHVEKPADGAMTTREIEKATGKSWYQVDRLVREACEKGLMVPVKVKRQSRDLAFRTTVAYVVVTGD